MSYRAVRLDRGMGPWTIATLVHRGYSEQEIVAALQRFPKD